MTDLLDSITESFSKRLPDPGLKVDTEQLQAIQASTQIMHPILAYLDRRAKQRRGLRRFVTWLAGPPAAPRGLYLWGTVGRGKTLLMDALIDCLDSHLCRRVHFHRFMLEVHERLNAARQTEADPLRKVGRDIALRTQVLALDEFQVSDIGDAMILSGLLYALIEHHVILLMTSNTRPSELYAGGLQRDRFIPAISLIETTTASVELTGNRDYRLEKLGAWPSYHVPDTPEANQQMQSLLFQIDPMSACPAEPLTLHGRTISARGAGDGVVWFDFAALCDGPRSKLDYVDLSKRYHTLLLSGVPQMHDDDDNAARRFIELIDELYDRRVNVVLSADALPDALYLGQRLRDDFKRTTSRLVEFQSAHYLAQAHRP